MNRTLSILVLTCILTACTVKKDRLVQNSEMVYERPEIGLKIKFHKPVVISVASRPEKWGFFQFPKIARYPDGTLLARWNMATDAIESYGSHHYGKAISEDGGKTWKVQKVEEPAAGLLLPNGDRIAVVTPTPIKVEDLKMPTPVGSRMESYPRKAVYTFYKMDSLPESRQGVYINRLRKGEAKWKMEKATLIDPRAARYELRGLVPILWSGDLQVAQDNSIIAGVYPGFYIREDGTVDPKEGIFFYRSTDNGSTWKIQGRIRYIPDLSIDPVGNDRMGFMEPAFEILNDGTFICVMRTSDGKGDGPMYISRSSDMGATWSEPQALTTSGVLPRLLQLDNGVIALSAGRPGVQLRFSADNGNTWTDALEMMPYGEKQKNNITWYDHVSCGYTGLLATGPNRLLIIYSDFRHLNEQKEFRNAIKVREVTVNRD